MRRRGYDPSLEEGQVEDGASGVMMCEHGRQAENRGCDSTAGQVEEVRVGSCPMLEALEWGSEKHVVGNGAMRGGVKSKML